MIELKIGNQEFREISRWDEHRITREITQRRRDGLPVCVLVRFTYGSNATITLGTCDCAAGGSVRTLTPLERRLVELWKKLRLEEKDFSAGNVIGFLKQAQNVCP